MLLAVMLPGAAAMAAGPETVEFREGDLTLKGVLFRPEGNGPFPAVVAMHNCAGLMNASGTIRTRYRDWAQQLVRMGFVVLFPDSYGPRGLGSLVRRPQPDHSLRPRAGRGRRRRAPLAPAARRGEGRPYLAARLVQWRHQRAVDGAPARQARGQRTTSAPPSRSIRRAGGSTPRPGAPGCRP